MTTDVTDYPIIKIDAGSLDRVLILIDDAIDDLHPVEVEALDQIRLAMAAVGYVPLIDQIIAARKLHVARSDADLDRFAATDDDWAIEIEMMG